MESRRSDRTKAQLFLITVLALALVSACSDNSSDQELTSTTGHQDVESVDVEMPDSTARSCLAQLRAFRRQALHASFLGFKHPITGKALAFNSPLPNDIQELINIIETAIALRACSEKTNVIL